MRIPPDRHCERKTAGREQTRYLFSCNLWAGAAPRDRERAARPVPSPPHHAVPPPPRTHMHPGSISLSLSPPSLPLWLSLSPSLPLPLSWPRPCHPRRHPWVRLGLRQAMSQLAGVLALGRRAGRCDCSRAGLSLFLFLISGGPFWSLSYFIILGGVFGGWGEEKSLFSWGLSVPSETFTKVMFSCLWWQPPRWPTGTGGLGAEPWGPGPPRRGETSPKGGLWGGGARGAPPSGLETGHSL